MYSGGVDTSCLGRARDHSKREMSWLSKMVISPSRTSEGASSPSTAFTSSGKRLVLFRPFRLVSVTWLPTFSATMRQPSYFSSYTQPSRWKGFGNSVACISAGAAPRGRD